MSVNSIYNNKTVKITNNSTFRMDRLDLLDESVAKELNTYRNWGEFPLLIEPSYDSSGQLETPKNAAGVKSLFNNVNAVFNESKIREYLNIPLLDAPSSRRKIRENTKCTIKDLVEASEQGLMGRAIYNYSDFMYCKHLGKVSNNYLITLRRFPVPCGDTITYIDPSSDVNLKMQDHMPDIGRMVTWMGVSGNSMENILKYNFNMPFTQKNAKLEDQQNVGDNGSQGVLGAIFNATDTEYQKQVLAGTAGNNVAGFMDSLFENTPVIRKIGGKSEPPYTAKEYQINTDQNKVYGPIDVIKDTYIRGEDGLKFSQDITLVFDYELRSYDGINTRTAMLDLLSNILAVTYTTGKFWGGGYRFYGAHQSNVFANLPIFKDAQSGKLNSWSSLQDSLMESYQSVIAPYKPNPGSGGTLDTVVNVAKQIASGLGGMLLGGMLNKLGRPQKMFLNSLLSPAPTGLWHLTIGNPRNPIMTMGNMIIEKTNIEHYGPLGLDDFPTGLKVSVTLKHGKPRDNSGIEQMYLRGDYRIYSPMSGKIESMYRNAENINNKKSTSYKFDNNITNDSVIRTAENSASPMKDKLYTKFFGTTNVKNIVIAAGEAAMGSVSPNKKGSTDGKSQ